jgi:hypothetical protein
MKDVLNLELSFDRTYNSNSHFLPLTFHSPLFVFYSLKFMDFFLYTSFIPWNIIIFPYMISLSVFSSEVNNQVTILYGPSGKRVAKSWEWDSLVSLMCMWDSPSSSSNDKGQVSPFMCSSQTCSILALLHLLSISLLYFFSADLYFLAVFLCDLILV